MITVHTRSQEETEAFAARIARRLAEGLASKTLESVLVGLSGPLGAGKTAFVRGFMAGLEPDRAADVSSPTYAIVQIYEGEPLVRHMDLYRIDSLRELEAIGGRELYLQPGIALVEWVENVPQALPEAWLEIRLAVEASDVREIALRPHGERLTRLLRGVEG